MCTWVNASGAGQPGELIWFYSNVGDLRASASARLTRRGGRRSPSLDTLLFKTGPDVTRALTSHTYHVGWKTRSRITLMSGTMLEPSTAARGAARGTSSLRAIRASRSRSRASVRLQPIRATSGRSPRSSPRSSRLSSSSRMSPIISVSASRKSPQDWSAWATSLRRAPLQRRKSVRPTSESGSSSLSSEKATSWPTPGRFRSRRPDRSGRGGHARI